MFKTRSLSSALSNLSAGFVAVLVGYTSTVAIVMQAAISIGATSTEISSWLFAFGIGLAVTCIGLSLYYRMPILTAWSTPGAALLVSSVSGLTMAEAVGAFIFSAVLIFLSGVTGFFKKAINHIPASLASAMLAGILLNFGINIFVAMQNQFALVGTLLVAYLIGKHLFARLVIPVVLLLSLLLANLNGLVQLDSVHITMSSFAFTAPEFSFAALISIGIPLYVVTMTSQNIPGFAIMHASGYHPPISSIISWTGITTLLLAPFGGFAFNLAAITAAICLSKEADPDPSKRYKATVYAGLFYLLAGLFSGTVVALFAALPKELILTIAGLALLGTIGSSLHNALKEHQHREPALITLLVSASGISLLGIGAAFWGLIAGVLSLAILKSIPVLKPRFLR